VEAPGPGLHRAWEQWPGPEGPESPAAMCPSSQSDAATCWHGLDPAAPRLSLPLQPSPVLQSFTPGHNPSGTGPPQYSLSP
jgi:hypothetical protein